MHWAVVLAGGRGERFWPLSRRSRPKQFLRLLGPRTMLQATVDRMNQDALAQVVVVTGEEYRDLVAEQLPGIPASNILGEPVGRNTAASVAWAGRFIMRRDENAVLTVVPSDHVLADVDAFRQALQAARDHAVTTGMFTLFGVVPRWADTGFGYIETTPDALDDRGVHGVVRFVEKPDADRAEAMLARGGFLWNSGMFVLPVQTLWKAYQEHLPELAAVIDHMVDDPASYLARFAELPSVSIDVGIMEKMRNLAVIPLDAGWDDVGTFQAVARLLASAHPERIVMDQAHDVVVIGDEGPLVAGLGVEHLVIVRTPDAILIMRPEESQAVRGLVARLRDEGHHHLL